MASFVLNRFTQYWCFVAALLCIVAGTGTARAHEDEQVQIDALTRLIARDPANAELYFKRGDLLYYKDRWDASLADLKKAEELKPGQPSIDFLIARTLLGARRAEEAIKHLDFHLAAHPADVNAAWTRGQALEAAGRPDEAVAAFDKTIAALKQPKPDHYFDRAQLLARIGDARLPEAIKGLDEGIARLGEVPTLELLAAELELRRKGYDAALTRLDKIKPGPGQRSDAWQLRRAEVLVAAGRKAEARAALEAALASIAKLPDSRKTATATVEAEAKIKKMLQETQGL